MEAFEVLTNIKNWTGYEFRGYNLSKAEAEACIRALEKATPKQPRRDEKYIWKCPECGKAYGDAEEDRHDYCPTCGQAIRWNREEEA